ncbi:Hypothetical predicted protein [Octopus vulgaris]|uniref:Major facilitator superfamily (MFS) profile domain-containing protein n=1 Tax=Octopus vulgaris TaxID=6645 RepID=A0AA36BD18_OCTVU|nr:Hypothetical predicted protein [Octopus vulgaris]
MLHCIQACGYTGNALALYSLTLEFTSSKLRTRISFGYMCLYPVAAIFVTVLVYCSFWFPLILVLLGKFGITSAYGSIYLLSAELFPTVVRANGLGLASFFARIGSISGPFILQLSSYVKWLPLSIFGLLAVIAGLLLLLLPETKNRDLPQTFEDLDNWKS